MNWTAVAAFTAAALSLVNVVISDRLASRGQREGWRREQERPVVARSLTLSEDALQAWWEASEAKEGMKGGSLTGSDFEQHWEKGGQLSSDLHYEVEQLDLLAGRSVRRAARNLLMAHHEEALRLVRERHIGEDDSEGRRAGHKKIVSLQDVLVDRARADLGLGSRLQARPGTLLARLLGQDQGWEGEPRR